MTNEGSTDASVCAAPLSGDGALDAGVPPPPLPFVSESGKVDSEKCRLEARILHKRTYGNRLVFFDVKPDEPGKVEQASGTSGPKGEESVGDKPAPSSTAPETDEDPGDKHFLEVVFSFECYGAEIRTIRKDICVGDVVEFHGSYRPCGRILDVVQFKISSRWRDEGKGEPFNAAAYGHHRVQDDGGRSSGITLKVSDAPDAQEKLFCKFWISNKSCQRDGCQCEHPDGEDLTQARQQYFALQKAKRARVANPNDPHSADGKKGHAHRASVFAEWVCSTFGLEELRRRGVIDIAGGRGELAFEFGVKRNIPCTVIDPRCPSEPLKVEPWSNFKLSKPQKAWLEENVSGLKGFPECQAYIATTPVRQSCGVVTPECTKPGTDRFEWWSQTIKDAQVIIGLHPDQATGGVVDLALAFGRGFAVVPCCTFADDFPDRELPNGDPVRTYDDLVEWLKLRGDGTESVFLPFQGKNQVVYNASNAAPAVSVSPS
eukprot:TRINITY_DN73523_c0_g1_i1.p1 TRINITY_DN73523_c0_g1~~TRINITY_DN73523_c0_g1_i1.p1  ORF type:complete len:499 (+),score=64.70 TRINITY_DN73523_c0_g1_i1:34-1497(+)